MIPETLQRLINEFNKLPGIGPKSATRLALYLLKSSQEDLNNFGEALITLRDKVRHCPICNNLTEDDICEICQDKKRNQEIICVVEEALDVIALEQMGEYSGLYHVLGGALSPIDNIGPDDLKIRELVKRLRNNHIAELILATDPDLEGEATAMYITRLIKPLNIKTTRIARGLPVGGDLEYADEMTLRRALEGRREY